MKAVSTVVQLIRSTQLELLPIRKNACQVKDKSNYITINYQGRITHGAYLIICCSVLSQVICTFDAQSMQLKRELFFE